MSERIRISYDGDVIILACNLIEASASLYVDGEVTPFVTAHAHHRTGHAVLLAAKYAWPDERWPKSPETGSDDIVANAAWDALEYRVLP